MPEIKPQALPYVRGRERLINWRKVAERLSISRSQAYELIGSGELGDVYRIGAGVRVAESALESYIERIKKDPLG